MVEDTKITGVKKAQHLLANMEISSLLENSVAALRTCEINQLYLE